MLRILKNPVYAGYMPYRDEIHPGEHDAIVDRDTYTRTRALLDEHGGKRRAAVRNPEYLLRGLLAARTAARPSPPRRPRRRARSTAITGA